MSEPQQTTTAPLHLFGGFGVELEYMIVDAESLSVLPVADQLLAKAVGEERASDFENGNIAWSNELVNHVIELKTNGPASSLDGLESAFAANVARIEELLRPLGGRLMPTAMHPWMNPETETKLWPHENSEVYRSFDRIFNCKGHGWANLQSVHINLPFANDEEFARLHAAIRVILPILPALAASSPLVEGAVTGILDNRLEYYRNNCVRIPSVTGRVIPEAVFSQSQYESDILQSMYNDVAPLDPSAVLCEEWLNARGAIARFSRRTIEIRLLDIQECPTADLAICRLVVAVLKALCDETWCSLNELKNWPVPPLHRILLQCIHQAELSIIEDINYLRLFGLNDASSCTAGALWQRLARKVSSDAGDLESVLLEGTLARRILRRCGDKPDKHRLHSICRELCACLRDSRIYR